MAVAFLNPGKRQKRIYYQAKSYRWKSPGKWTTFNCHDKVCQDESPDIIKHEEFVVKRDSSKRHVSRWMRSAMPHNGPVVWLGAAC